MNRGESLQDLFLHALRTERVPVAVYLVNGIKLHGHIDSFDQYGVLLRGTTGQQLVYKRAISTFVPGRDMRLSVAEERE